MRSMRTGRHGPRRSGPGIGLHPARGEITGRRRGGAVLREPPRRACRAARGDPGGRPGRRLSRSHRCSSSSRSRSASSSGCCSAAGSAASRTCGSTGPGSRSPGSSSSSAIFSEPLGSLVGDAGPAIYVASNLGRPRGGAAEPGHPGLALVAIGAGCNLVAILANGGRMPADPSALATAGFEVTGSTNSVVVANPALWPLTDIFAIPASMPGANVFSVGDVLIARRHRGHDRARDAARPRTGTRPGRRAAVNLTLPEARLHASGDRRPHGDRLPVPRRGPAHIGQAAGRPALDPRTHRDPDHQRRRPELDGRREHDDLGRAGGGRDAS